MKFDRLGRLGSLGIRSQTPYKPYRSNTSRRGSYHKLLPQRIPRTRSVTAKIREDEETEEMKQSEMETKRLETIREEHATESTQLGELKAAGWFNMGLHKFKTLSETIEYAKKKILNLKSRRSIIRLRNNLKKQQKILSELTTDHVNEVSFYEFFSNEDPNHVKFKELLVISEDPNFIKVLNFKNIPDNTGDSFKSYYSNLFQEQRKLGLDTIKHLLAEIKDMLKVWLKKNKSTRLVDVRYTKKKHRFGGNTRKFRI
jgi:hypothetical protein